MITEVTRMRPPRIAMSLLAIAAVWQWLLPLPAAELYSSTLAATILFVAGLAVMTIAWWQFKQQQVAICPTETTARLVTDGVYRFTRNPMYLGILMMLIAVAILVGTLPFVVAAGLFFLIIRYVFCPYEEQKLESAFGGEYRRYRGRVRRWI